MDPICINRDGHRTWLKWHRARRRADDPEFGGSRIVEGMRLGASVEVDLVIHADHGCAVLHDFDLDHGTTGRGLVRETRAEVLRGLHLRDNAGAVLPERVMLLEDLCALLKREPAHPEARLQLDFKEDAAALDPLTVARFGRLVGPVAQHMILSGGDAGAVATLAAATPGLATGYDPCHGESLARLLADRDFAEFIAGALETAPDAGLIYLDHRIVLAADEAGFDMIGAVHAGGKGVDAWTIQSVTPETVAQCHRLIALRADQITTDDPEGLMEALRP